MEKLKDAICDLVSIAEEHLKREDFEELDNAGAAIIDCLDELETLRKQQTNGFTAKSTGIIRRLDDLNRIAIPKEIRMKIFGKNDAYGEPLEFFIDGDNIVLKKYEDVEKRKEQEIRNKAIEDFAKKIKSNSELGYIGYLDRVIDEIAEEMKGSGNL